MNRCFVDGSAYSSSKSAHFSTVSTALFFVPISIINVTNLIMAVSAITLTHSATFSVERVWSSDVYYICINNGRNVRIPIRIFLAHAPVRVRRSAITAAKKRIWWCWTSKMNSSLESTFPRTMTRPAISRWKAKKLFFAPCWPSHSPTRWLRCSGIGTFEPTKIYSTLVQIRRNIK